MSSCFCIFICTRVFFRGALSIYGLFLLSLSPPCLANVSATMVPIAYCLSRSPSPLRMAGQLRVFSAHSFAPLLRRLTFCCFASITHIQSKVTPRVLARCWPAFVDVGSPAEKVEKGLKLGA
ncbi:hypothetical protein BASA62_010491 [Batrachochytrium salamandrivorans]|nr:hypothetical protein BASA62_010491 [Batrachochytrium salamandrivorans]